MTVLNSTDVRIEEKASSIESVLEWLGEDLEKVDQEFRKNLKSGVPIISAIGEHLLLSGGKRFRPTLLLLSAKLCGYQGEHHISLASLIEFIHTATLLHDDVVDRAQLRRGSLSANSIWGNEACVLVGDFLFTKCFSLMVENGNLKILHTISKGTTLMAEGELDELVRTNDLSLTEEGYLSIVARKTGALISAAGSAHPVRNGCGDCISVDRRQSRLYIEGGGIREENWDRSPGWEDHFTPYLHPESLQRGGNGLYPEDRGVRAHFQRGLLPGGGDY
jgi:hypothetical protein